MKNRAIIVGMLFLACASFVPCFGQQNVAPPTYIRGEVRDAVTHLPIPNARVILELARYGYVDETNTDQAGKFQFQHLTRSVYMVRIKQPGYKGTEQATNSCDPRGCRRADLTASTMEFVNFNLEPVAGPASERPPGEPISSAELQVPEPARKELDTGKELALAGKAGESIGHFKKAIELYPDYEQAYFRMGLAFLDVNDLKQAEAALTMATQLNPKDGAAFLALGSTYARQRDFAGAEKPLLRGLQLDPDAAVGQCDLSLAYWALHRLAESEQHAQKCATLKPDYAQAHLLLGNLALAKHDQAGALREYREYLRLDPQGSYAAGARKQVDKLQKEVGAGGPGNS